MRTNRATLSVRSETAATLAIAAGIAISAASATAGIVIPPGSPVRTWTGDVSNNWHTAGNWTTSTVPVGNDAVLILDADANVILTNTTNNLATLYVAMNRALDTNGHALRVFNGDGRTTITGIESQIAVVDSGLGIFEFDTNELIIENDGRLQLYDGSARIREQLTADTGGRVLGNGLLRVTSNTPAALNLFNADPLSVTGGNLSIQVFNGGSFAPPQTIQLLQPGRLLNVDAPLFTPVRDLVIGENCFVAFQEPWTVEGEITAQPGAGNNATIQDAAPLNLEGEIRVNSGNMVINTDTDLNIGSIVRLSTNIFESKSLRFTATTNSFPGSETNVGHNCTLILDGPIPSDWQGEINTDAGIIEANAPAGFWTVDGTMNTNSFAGLRTTLNGTAATRITGQLNANGTGLTANAPLVILNTGEMNLNSASTQLVVNDLLALHPSSNTTGDGRITINAGAQAFFGTSADVEVEVDNHGTLHTGLAVPQVGYSYIGGDYTQSATGTVVVELGGLSPLQHDVYETAGSATLAGTIEVALADGFVPEVGDTFTVFYTNADLVGSFDTVGGEPGFEVEYFAAPNRVVLTYVGVSTPCIGDLSGDGVVNADDLGILLAAFGISDGGDLNDDGVTDADDLGILLSAFGSSCE